MAKYRIEIPHFYCLDYYEGNKVMRLDIDFRDTTIYLRTSLVKKWLPPNENISIAQQDKERILKNIYAELLKNDSKENIIIRIGE